MQYVEFGQLEKDLGDETYIFGKNILRSKTNTSFLTP